MTGLVTNPIWLKLQHKLTLDDIDGYEWRWDVHPVNYGGPMYEYERDRYEYLIIKMKDGREYEITKDTFTDIVFCNQTI